MLFYNKQPEIIEFFNVGFTDISDETEHVRQPQTPVARHDQPVEHPRQTPVIQYHPADGHVAVSPHSQAFVAQAYPPQGDPHGYVAQYHDPHGPVIQYHHPQDAQVHPVVPEYHYPHGHAPVHPHPQSHHVAVGAGASVRHFASSHQSQASINFHALETHKATLGMNVRPHEWKGLLRAARRDRMRRLRELSVPISQKLVLR